MENYESLGVIGEGTYGVVMRARHRETGQVVAIKKFKESDEDEQVRKTSLREVRVLKQLRHDNIITLLEVFRRKGKLYLVFEYVDRTILELLEGRPNGLDENDVRRYTYQLLRGVEYCHAHNVMHRDIKPENILISRNGTLKLCDFGFARTMSIGGKYTDYVATRWYRGPELLVGDVEYTKGVDIWAIGCIFAEISNGMPLFPGESDVDQLAHIMRCFGRLTTRQAQTFRRNPLYVGVELPNPRDQETLESRFPDMPRPWLQLLKACLKNDPEQRESCTGLMNLPYFTDGNFRADFEHELRLLFDKEQRMLQGVGARSSSNKPPAPAHQPQQQLPEKPAKTTAATPPAQTPDVPASNPGRGESPVTVSAATTKKTQPATVPSIGSLWSQYLASTTATPSGHAGVDQLPDLGHKVQALQTQHPLFAQSQGQRQGQGRHDNAAPAGTTDHRGATDPLSLPPRGPNSTQAAAASHHYTTQPAQAPSLSMTSATLSTKGYQPPSSSQQATRTMFPSLGCHGQTSSSTQPVANPSLGLSYKKKGTKKNVLSTLNAGGAYGNSGFSLPNTQQSGGGYPNPYALGGPGGMMLQGHHTGTSQPPQSQQGPRRTSKPWGH